MCVVVINTINPDVSQQGTPDVNPSRGQWNKAAEPEEFPSASEYGQGWRMEETHSPS